MTNITIATIFKKHKNHNPLCKACEEKAYRVVTIEKSILRGDDEIYLACERHTKMAREDFQGFYRDIETEQRRRKYVG